MSVSIEWFDAEHTGVDVARAGYWPEGSEDPVTAEVAVIIGADSLAVIEGDRERVRYLLRVALDSLDDEESQLGPEDGWDSSEGGW